MISDEELTQLEADVNRALDGKGQERLKIMGYGVTAVVFGLPAARPEYVCKRLPPNSSQADFERHRALVLDYVEQMRQAGIAVLDTEVKAVPSEGRAGGVTGYIIQPALDPSSLGNNVLRAADPAEGHPLVPTVVDLVAGFTTDRRGIDAQITNWAWVDGSHRYIDVTTPFLLDDQGEVALDLEIFLKAAPAVAKGTYRKELPPAILRTCDTRFALLDLCGLLYKNDLDAWVPVVIEECNRVVDPPITVEEARTHYDGEVKTWSMMNRVLRADRFWQRHVRRRRYGFFVPPMEYDPKTWKAKKKGF
jgi:hypothetical protein